ncbi:3-hydroxyacyl-CoA dehydrogenase family protein [Kibdelosporangium persicum]|uniref:Glyceryl-ACP oxidoreductase n=1 Tax=Kibdelosporangium persicum TaxID=2698649 RepID=A0ABX2F5F8_9PSEU|nr:3-hydroxyacyl-CoA dehydrogenase family protein [Kibdelosporangium persicum]NRN66576.1 Glyceryl-ACP oxidoreductase [Kibdelosporangium persicum]
MTTDQQFHRIAVLGAGVMGSGITTLALGSGVSVDLVDVDTRTLDRARSGIRTQLRHAQLLGALPGDRPQGELTTSVSMSGLAHADAVIEAITEDAGLKAKVLGEVSELVRPGTPVISNTSGIPIDELAGAVRRPEDLLGTHFMNPTYLISMVEVIRGPRTGDAVLAATQALLTTLRRKAVVVRDAPGFVTSRLLHPMINDAARIVAEGTATVEDVDTLMQGCLGHPTGPLRTADLIGIDNLVDALDALYERTGEKRNSPCELLREKVRAGELGRKSGRGFYDYGEGIS